MPQKKNKDKKVRNYGKIQINNKKYKFNERFEKFTFKTLYVNCEVVSAMILIRKECEYVINNKPLYKLDFDKVWKIDEFRVIQHNHIANIKKYLSVTWGRNIENIIREQIVSIGKGWFNMNETIKET